MKKLNLTPEEICNMEFPADFKGYDPAQVDSLLDLIMEDYEIMEENMQELLDCIASLQNELKEVKAENEDLAGQKRAFDLSHTTNYSSVDLLKRISRLEQIVLKK